MLDCFDAIQWGINKKYSEASDVTQMTAEKKVRVKTGVKTLSRAQGIKKMIYCVLFYGGINESQCVEIGCWKC